MSPIYKELMPPDFFVILWYCNIRYNYQSSLQEIHFHTLQYNFVLVNRKQKILQRFQHNYGHDDSSSYSGSFQLLMTIILLNPLSKLRIGRNFVFCADFIKRTLARKIIYNCLLFFCLCIMLITSLVKSGYSY